MSDSKPITTYFFYHPQSNLPAIKAGVTPEAQFVDAFTESYWRTSNRVHSGSTKTEMCFAKEIPVSGLGIADLVSIAWNPQRGQHTDWLHTTESDAKHPTVRAFEMKLSNWKKGLMQAHRYKFFSDSSILVLPINQLNTAVENLLLFEKLEVGLWGYNSETGRIRKVYTPRPVRPKDTKHRCTVLQRVFLSSTTEHVA